MNSAVLIVIMFLFFVFCIGAIIGSFLNVVILRAFSGESIVLPPSKCPKCGNKLKWWHNIPILSYVLLRGKCYFCHEKISIQYPIVEFITGLIFVAVFMKFGLQVDTFFAFAIAGLLVVLTVTDIKERIVFDAHTYSLIAVGLIYNLYLTISQVLAQVNTIVGFSLTPEWCVSNPITMSILGLSLGAVIMEIAARCGYLIAGQRGFGEGDTYIAAGLGAVFGWRNVVAIIVMAIGLQILFTLPLFLKKLAQNKDWKTFSSLVLFFLYAIGFYVLEFKTSLLNNIIFEVLAIFVMFVLGIMACLCLIKGLKNKENLTYLPFGPALAIAGMILLVTNANLLLGLG